MTNELRCLNVQQPWAWALCAGEKDIENRSWTTKYRGTVVIVASSKKSVVSELIKSAKPRALSDSIFTFSAAIGLVDIIDVTPLNPQLEKNPWAFGPYCWRVANARLFPTPIPCKGKLNLYKPDEDIAIQIREQIPKAAPIQLNTDARAWVEGGFQHTPLEERTEDYIESYVALEDWPNLERLAKIALLLVPDDFYVLIRYGQALHEQERNDEALIAFEQAIKIDPDNAWGYAFRSYVHGDLGNTDKAKLDLARAIEIDPSIDSEKNESDSDTDADAPRSDTTPNLERDSDPILVASPALALVVGDQPIPRSEVTKRLWDYIQKNNLQDKKNPRKINADANLKAVFGGKGTVSMFEMTKLVSNHLNETE